MFRDLFRCSGGCAAFDAKGDDIGLAQGDRVAAVIDLVGWKPDLPAVIIADREAVLADFVPEALAADELDG